MTDNGEKWPGIEKQIMSPLPGRLESEGQASVSRYLTIDQNQVQCHKIAYRKQKLKYGTE